MTMPPPKQLDFSPYLRGGTPLIAGVFNDKGLNITDRDYHQARSGLMSLRANDPKTAAQFDRFLIEVVDGKKTWPQAQQRELSDALAKNGLDKSRYLVEVGRDLKAHGYSHAYRPSVSIDINGRPMNPELIAAEYRSRGINLEGTIPVSSAPGKISGGVKISFGEAEKFAEKYATAEGEHGFKKTANILSGELVEHGRRFGVIGKVAGAAVAGTLAAATGVNAAEIGSEALNAALPGAGTLATGGGSKSSVCKAFSEVAGAVAGTGAGIAAGALTSLTGPGAVAVAVGVGVATEAAVSPLADKLCMSLSR